MTRAAIYNKDKKKKKFWTKMTIKIKTMLDTFPKLNKN